MAAHLEPLSYWLIVTLRASILITCLVTLKSGIKLNTALHAVVVILTVDAIGTLLESLYFGAHFNSLYHLLSEPVPDLLGSLAFLLIPKLFNIASACVVLFMLTRRWFPQISAEQKLNTAPISTEAISRRKDGEIYQIELDVTPIYDEADNARHWISIERDIAGRKDHELTEARNRAEGASKAKSIFLATMSHELRTPLNAIIGFSDLMIHQPSTVGNVSKAREYAENIRSSGKHLLALIDEILDLSCIEAGRRDITKEQLDLFSIWTNIADHLHFAAIRKGVDIHSPHGSGEYPFLGDRRSMGQVISNIVANAIKFTPAGGTVSLWSSFSSQTQEVVIHVQDDGKGIPGAFLEMVTQPFVQVGNVDVRSEGGVGLGLAICKSLLAAMRGRLTIESTEGVGIHVLVYLPAVSSSLDASFTQTDAAEGHFRRRNV